MSTVILGGSRIEHLQENIKALEDVKKITDEVNDKIEEILGNKPAHPQF